MNPSLSELPAPPSGKSGWPWTEGSSAVGPEPAGGWPRISVVTPSFNQGAFIEETIRSVLLQGYPNLEYLILDGGSTDETVAILKKYSPWLTYWVSEKDGGQAAAINRGWSMATGEFLAWICSDDWYFPDTFLTLAKEAAVNPETDWFGGGVEDQLIDSDKILYHPGHPTPLLQCLALRDYGYYQPGMFWRRRLFTRTGWLNENLNYGFDHEFWARSLIAGCTMHSIPRPFARFRRHAASKTCTSIPQGLREAWQVFDRFKDRLTPPERKAAAAWLKEYEAEWLATLVYNALLNGQRLEALRLTMQGFPLFPHFHPPKLYLGMLSRVLITGRAPSWWQGKY